MSPTPGRSTLITSAPSQARSCVQVGPDCTWVKSRMRTPVSALPSCPYGLLDARDKPLCLPLCLSLVLPFALRAAASFTTLRADFFAAAFVFFCFFLAISSPPSLRLTPRTSGHPASYPIDVTDLFLAKHALRGEIADAATLAAGCRIDHRGDEGGVPGVHRRVHCARSFIRRRRIDADAAEGLHYRVVAGALHERGRRRVRAGVVDVGPAIDAVVVED